mmetsp:Transcript_16058/g.39447  ORF Transcript_16058/g.39447 Transcript_16058/m.39447 type:complete len:287 (-) Transcript_16058:95-955(-)
MPLALTHLVVAMVGATTTRRFFIARHGQTSWNFEERLQGTIDESLLTAAGELQAAGLGKRLVAEEAGRIDAVFVSSMQRARQTHDAVQRAFGQEVSLPEPTFSWELREIELFQWQGRLKAEVATGPDAEHWHRWKKSPATFAFDDGVKPLHELWKRAQNCWDELLLPRSACEASAKGDDATHPHTTLVIAHGALGRALLAVALGLPMESFNDSRFQFDNCAWAELEMGPMAGTPTSLSRDGMSITKWRWRHPGPASEWSTVDEEQAAARARLESTAAVEAPEPMAF